MKKIYFMIALAAVACMLLSNKAFAREGVSQNFVLTRSYASAGETMPEEGNAVNVLAREEVARNFVLTRPYVGAGVIIPKEGNVDIGYGVTVGFEIVVENETLFIDATFSRPGLDSTFLPGTGNVRNTFLNMGYKTNFGGCEKWMIGAGLQSHRMEFGNRKMSALTLAALVEYKLGKKTGLRLVSSQLYSKLGARFGAFQLNVIQYF